MVACKLRLLTLVYTYINFGCFYFVHPYYSLFSMVFIPHKVKQPLATRYGFSREKKYKSNIESLSNDQRSQMRVYIALKKM